jgi:hypothetical protein
MKNVKIGVETIEINGVILPIQKYWTETKEYLEDTFCADLQRISSCFKF